MKIDICVLTFNRKEYTKISLESLIRNTGRELYRLLVYDDHSEDGSISYLRDLGIDKLIVSDENRGTVYGRNRLLEEVESEYVVISDNDCFYEAGWLEDEKKILDENDDIGISTCYETKNIKVISERYGCYIKSKASSINFMIRKSILEYFGGFRTPIGYENTRMNYSDSEICKRMTEELRYKVGVSKNRLVYGIDEEDSPYFVEYGKYSEWARMSMNGDSRSYYEYCRT